MFPERYQSGSTRQLSAKQDAAIRPAVASSQLLKVRSRFLERVIDLSSFF
jgi:hypothetical protein